MHIAVVGSGYVGLVTGACLADFGMDVTCVDNDTRKIKMLQRGQIPIFEPGLDALVAKNEKAGRLHFTTELKEAIEQSLAIFIAVGTPPREDGSADLTYVVEVAEAIADHMNGYKVVITKSTVPIGTGQFDRYQIGTRYLHLTFLTLGLDPVRSLARSMLPLLPRKPGERPVHAVAYSSVWGSFTPATSRLTKICALCARAACSSSGASTRLIPSSARPAARGVNYCVTRVIGALPVVA